MLNRTPGILAPLQLGGGRCAHGFGSGCDIAVGLLKVPGKVGIICVRRQVIPVSPSRRQRSNIHFRHVGAAKHRWWRGQHFTATLAGLCEFMVRLRRLGSFVAQSCHDRYCLRLPVIVHPACSANRTGLVAVRRVQLKRSIQKFCMLPGTIGISLGHVLHFGKRTAEVCSDLSHRRLVRYTDFREFTQCAEVSVTARIDNTLEDQLYAIKIPSICGWRRDRLCTLTGSFITEMLDGSKQ